MNTMNKMMIVGTIGAMSLATAAQAVVIANVTPVSSIDPTSEADNIAYNTPFALTNYSSGTISKITAVAPSSPKMTMANKPGVVILNFEAAQGFGTALQSISSGSVFTNNGTVAPYSSSDRITSITFGAGHSIQLQSCGLTGTGSLAKASSAISTDGVFLVGDPAGTTVTSGSQGLIAGRVWNGTNANGILITFDADVSAVSFIQNAAGSWTTDVYLFDAQGNALARTTGGLGGGYATFMGVESSNVTFRSVWIGQTSATNGLIIDDLAFVYAVPEPATAGIVLMGGLGALGLLRKR